MPGTITTDLTTYDSADAATNWVSIGTFATAPVANTDMNIQGSNALVGRISANSAWFHASNAGLDLTTGNHVFIWLKNVTWPGTDTKANGGLRVCLSSDATPTLTGTSPSNGPTNSKNWYVDGTDTQTVVGWVCYVIDPNSTPDLTLGSPVLTSIKRIGYGSKILSTIGAGSFKPSNLLVDVIRYGTGLTINNGTSGSPVAFTDIFATDSNTTNSYGVITSFSGGYFLAGKLTFGTSAQSAITYFKDTNQVITYLNFPVAQTFYEIKVQGASSFATTFQLGNFASNVASSGCTLTAAGSACWTLTASDGYSTTNLYACSLSRMRRGSLNSSCAVRSCTISNSGELTSNGATIDSCIFQSVVTTSPISGTWALIIASPTQMASVTNCNFISCNNGIKLTSSGTYTFSNIKFSGNTFDVDANFTATTADSYSETNQDTTTSLQDTVGANISGAGQSFTGNGGTLSSCRFYLKKTGSPTGTAVAKVYAHSGTFGTSSIPTGTALATSQTLTVSSLTTSYALTEFKFKGSNNITLTNATKYIVTIEYSSGSSGNTVDVGKDTSSPSHGGNGSTFASSAWTASSTTDYCFYLYTSPVTINVTNGGGTPVYQESLGVSVTVNNAVTLSVMVEDTVGSPIQNARVAIYKTSDGTELLNTLTNSSGIASTSYAYTADTAIDIRVRKSSTGSTRYVNNDSAGTITSTGFSSIVVMIQDTIASP